MTAHLIQFLQNLFILEEFIFWDVSLCNLIEVYGRFRGAFCFHHYSFATCCLAGWLFDPEGGGSVFFWNFDKLIPDGMA
jgi:hypothetical protein